MGAKYVRNITKLLKATSGRLFGRVTSGTGRGEELTPESVRTLLSVSTTAETAALLADKADLVGGVIPTAQIPAVAISEYLGSVLSQSAMLALSGDRGDWCLRSDLSTTWVLSDDDSSLLASWIQLSYPTAPVTSVAGRTGVVTLSNTDISGLGTLATQSGTFSGTSSNTNTGDQNLFSTIAVSGQSNVVADQTSDTLTLIAGTNITITTDASTDAITITAAGGGSPGGSTSHVQYNSGGSFAGSAALTFSTTTTHLTITSQSAAYVPLCIIAAASQSGNLIEVKNSSSSTVWAVSSDGLFVQFGNTVTTTGIRRAASSQSMILRSSGITTIQGSGISQVGGTAGLLLGDVDYGTYYVSTGGFGGQIRIIPNVMGNSSRNGADVYVAGGTASSSGNWNGGNIYLNGGTKNGTGVVGNIIMNTLPTSSPGVTGALWNDAGTLKIS